MFCIIFNYLVVIIFSCNNLFVDSLRATITELPMNGSKVDPMKMVFAVQTFALRSLIFRDSS